MRSAFGLGLVALLACSGLAFGQQGTLPAGFQKYETQYYIIYSDQDIWVVREAAARLTAMFETYRERTKEFGGRISSRFPFYLFGKSADYHAAGGPQGSGGVYMGRKLMACLGSTEDPNWEVVQHEGFHQFADHVIGGNIPSWLDEGLADYFAAGIWTGDGYVTGAIPSWRLRTVQTKIRDGKMKPARTLMKITSREWLDPAGPRDYDEAWAMVHYLAHGDGGKYQKAFSGMLAALAHGRPFEKSWTDNFGPDMEGFEKACWTWWMKQTRNATEDKQTLATVQTLTSYLARATSMGQKFEDAKSFLQTAHDGKLQFQTPEQWLPDSLLKDTLAQADRLSEWSLEKGKTYPALALKTPAGKTYRGRFELAGKKIVKAEAAEMIESGK